MTGETVECFNCGRPNPAWARVCRYCGVPLVAGDVAAVNSRPFPTDQHSLLSMGAAIATIVAAVIIGVIFSNLNPTDPTVGLAASPTPTASRPVASVSTEPTAQPTRTPKPKPQLPGTVAFGTGLDSSTCKLTDETNEFGPGTAFAHVIKLDEPFGVDQLTEKITRIRKNAKDKVVEDGANRAPANESVVCYSVRSDDVIANWGTGRFIMRVYRGDEQIAEGRFRLSK